MISAGNHRLSCFVFAFVLLLFFSSPTLARTVKVMDTGMNMLRETIELPAGWKINADIASNPVSGEYVRFKHDVIGPNGEILRELPPFVYGIVTGRSFDQTWRIIVNEAIGELMDIETVSEPVRNGPVVMRSLKAMSATPGQFNASAISLLEVKVTGRKNNEPYTAVLVITNQSFGMQNGMVITGIVASPSKRFDAAVDASIKITQGKKLDPTYDARRAALIDQTAQNAAVLHQQRMNSNQQLFNQHQDMMRERSQMQDQQHQQWMNNNFSGNTPGGGAAGYSTHDAYIDSINETSTFADPSTGQNRTLDGQYRYNYTDGMGGYYGTDDAGVNPGAMPGNWQETQPLQPGY